MLANLASSYERRADRLGLALVALMRASIPELAPNAGAEAVRLAAGVLNRPSIPSAETERPARRVCVEHRRPPRSHD